MSARSYQLYKTTIPAGITESFNAFGHAFYLIRSTDKVDIKTDKTAYSEYTEKQGVTADKGFTFNRLEVRNNNAFAVTVVLWAGFGRFEDARQFLFDAQTEAVGSNETSLAAAASITFAGTPFSDKVQRRDIVITNNSVTPGERLDLVDSSGNAFASVPAGTAYLHTSPDSITIENNNGGAIDYRVGENWYVI